MILDTLGQSARYESLHPRFAKAFAFLRGMTGTEAPGRHEIDGDDLFALVQQVTTKPLNEALFEAHQQYIDVQYVYHGRETILWAPLKSMREQTRAYDASRDIAKWEVIPDFTPLHLEAGYFTILYPEDAHAPCVEWEQATDVFKAVVKVRVN